MMLGILQIGSAVIVIPVLIWIWFTKSFAVALMSRFASCRRRLPTMC